MAASPQNMQPQELPLAATHQGGSNNLLTKQWATVKQILHKRHQDPHMGATLCNLMAHTIMRKPTKMIVKQWITCSAGQIL